jgi:hypothetical protein
MAAKPTRLVLVAEPAGFAHPSVVDGETDTDPGGPLHREDLCAS